MQVVERTGRSAARQESDATLRRSLAGVLNWLRSAHSAKTEIVVAAGLYLVYEGGRGLVAHSFGLARHHAELVVGTERSLHILWEQGVEEAVTSVPVLMPALGALYMTLHAGATILLLVWLYRRRRDVFPFARNALIAATALALVVHIAFPTAPPRLIGLTADAVTDRTHINLNSHVLGALYNPIAAMPSLHFGYALLVGLVVAKFARSIVSRILGLLYPGLVLFVIVATGNHYILDAVAGAAVMVAGIGAAIAVCHGLATNDHTRLSLVRSCRSLRSEARPAARGAGVASPRAETPNR
jgi:hypothetical protein